MHLQVNFYKILCAHLIFIQKLKQNKKELKTNDNYENAESLIEYDSNPKPNPNFLTPTIA